MRAAVIEISNEDQRDIVRRLFRESGNVNVQTKEVFALIVSFDFSLFQFLRCRLVKQR